MENLLFLHKIKKMAQQQGGFNISPVRTILGLGMAILVLMGLYYLAAFAFKVLLYATPVLLIATAVIDYSVITGFVGWLKRVYKANSTTGLILIVLSVLVIPFTSLFLFSRAMFRRKVKQMSSRMEEQIQQQKRGEYADYEDMDSEPLVLPNRTKEKPKQGNEYTDYEDILGK